MVLLLVANAWACPPLSDAVERMTLAVVNGLDPAGPRADVAASLQCAPAEAAVLSRWYLAEGAAAWLAGDPTAARWFLASRRLAPDAFDPRFGPQVRAAWESASPDGRATLTVDLAASVDGKPVDTWPVAVDAGPVVVQVIARDGSVRFFRAVDLAPGDEALLPTLLPPEAGTKKKKSPALLVAGGAAAVLAGVAGGLAAGENTTIDQAGSVAELDAASTRQRAFGYAAYGLGGAALVGVGLWFVLP